jgi:LacI family transcriptional regulator
VPLRRPRSGRGTRRRRATMTGRAERGPTIKEVARLAGVAPSSVSRAMNGHADVSEVLRQRVMQAASQLGYQPDLLAQSLRRGATRTVGFIVRDISVPLFAGIVKGAEQELESRGYSILLTNSLRSPALEAKHIGVLCQRRVDGLILSLQSERAAETVNALRRVQVPVVLLDREVSGVSADAVLFDHASGVRDAVTALLGLGHRRVGFVLGSPLTRASRDRLRGFRSGFERAGLPLRCEDVRQMEVYAPGFAAEATRSLLGRPSPPTALVAGDAQLGVGMLLALKGLGLRHGADVSVVVCDDVELFQAMDPPVSVVARNAEDMGVLAARLLAQRLRDHAAPRMEEVLPTEFVLRGSVLPPPR